MFPIWLLCWIAGISTSSYYRYKKRPLNASSETEDKILDIYIKSGKRAGYRAIRDTLSYKYNLTVNHKKVYRIMRENGISSIVRKKKRMPKEKVILRENILNRSFQAKAPGEKFVTDITYIPTTRTMAYLCTVIDLYNNEPVVWNISTTQDKNLSLETIKTLAKKYNLENSIIHSDQGVHYTNNAYVELLKKLKARQSMSRKGNCWDNAKAESFFAHLKSETIHLMKKRIKDLNEVERMIEQYMDYYINDRPQKALGGLSPRAYSQAMR